MTDHTTRLTRELDAFVREHWTAFAAFAASGPRFIDGPGYVLVRGPLAPPEPYNVLAACTRGDGSTIHLVRFHPGPCTWVDVDEDRPVEPGTIEFAARKGPGCGGLVAWEPEPGVRVWVEVPPPDAEAGGPWDAASAHERLQRPALPFTPN